MAKRYAKYKPIYDEFIKFYPFGLEDLPEEIWQDIPNYGDYQVSTFGRIKSLKHTKPRIMRPALNSSGYLFVEIHKNNSPTKFLIARLVAEVFIPNPDNKPEVNHLHGRFNNHFESLEWATGSENMLHAFLTGLAQNAQGADDSQAKLTAPQIEFIRNNNTLTNEQFGLIFDVSDGTICNIRRGKTYKNASGKIRLENGGRKLSEETRKEIRKLYNTGEYNQYEIASFYKVNQTTICRIIKEAD